MSPVHAGTEYSSRTTASTTCRSPCRGMARSARPALNASCYRRRHSTHRYNRTTCTTSRGRRAPTTWWDRTFRASALPRSRSAAAATRARGTADRTSTPARDLLKTTRVGTGAYPYGHITIVDPAFQSGAGGMEYPTLFHRMARGGWLRAPGGVTTPGGRPRVQTKRATILYGIVATTSSRTRGWTRAQHLSRQRAALAAGVRAELSGAPLFWRVVRGWSAICAQPGNRGTAWPAIGRCQERCAVDADLRYYPSTAAASLQKTALWLNTMERLAWLASAERILSTHFTRSAFTHPKPADFFATAMRFSGQDLAGTFDQVYRSSNVFGLGRPGT